MYKESALNIIEKVKDKARRHKERHCELGYQYIFSDSIHFVNGQDWDSIAKNNTIFLSRDYLQTIEKYSPENTSQRYAIAYSEGEPVLVIACQLAEISGEQLIKTDSSAGGGLKSNYRERVLVCGNLVSSGLHGVGFSDTLDEEVGWRIVAEVLYKIRRSEKLSGEVDFALIKDVKGDQVEVSKVIERFSYRKIQTDPDMVLDLGEGISSFDDYLKLLNSKYRSRINKTIKRIDQSDFRCEKLVLNETVDKKIHELYLQVEKRSKTSLATLPQGYFLGLSQSLSDNFACYGIVKGDEIAGFITVIKDRDDAVAYYVGFDYDVNDKHPLYFRLLQLVIESAVSMQCKKVLFGRSALEPKANLGAKPIDSFVWARHRVPVVNFFVRKLFRNVPFDEAPERGALKKIV